MESTLFKSYDPAMWWIDRLGNMEFINDQHFNDTMNPAYYCHMIRLVDKAQFNLSALMY